MRTVINGQDVYLDGDNIPEFSYSLTELTDITKIRGSSSTTFEIPATNGARLGLGGPGIQEEVLGDVPIRIGDQGQILFEGVCRPTEWTDEQIEVVAYGDNATWFDKAKSTKCVDIDLGLTGPVTATAISTRWSFWRIDPTGELNAFPFYWPVIDYGSMASFTGASNITLDKMRWAVSVHHLLRKFFENEGFTLKVGGSLSRIWKKLTLPSAGHTYKSLTGRVTRRAPQTVEVDWALTIPYQTGINGITETVESSTTFDAPSGANGSFISTTIPANVTISVNGTFRIQRSPTFPDFGTSLVFRLYNNTDSTGITGNIVASITIPVPPGGVTVDVPLNQVLFSLQLDPTKSYTLYVFPLPSQSSLLQSTYSPRLYMLDGTSFTYEATPLVNDTVVENFNYQVTSAIAPSLGIGDVISSLCTMLRLVVTTNQLTNEVTFYHYDDYLLEVGDGVDWRDRLTHNTLPVKVRPDQPERYVFKYTSDDKDEAAQEYNGETQWTAEGIYATDGLDEEKENTVKFAATQQGPRFAGITVPVLKEVDKVTDYVKCKPRILVFGGYYNEGDTLITFNGTGYSYCPRFYFAGQGGGDVNLGFGDDAGRPGTVSTFWRESLVRAGKPFLRGEFRVFDDEFMNFDFARPRLVNDGHGDVWMYVQSVKGKKFGDDDLVECELIPL